MTEVHKVKMALKAHRRNDYLRMAMASFVPPKLIFDSPKRKVHEHEREIARRARQTKSC